MSEKEHKHHRHHGHRHEGDGRGGKGGRGKRPLVSFVIPCYRSAGTLPGVVSEIDRTMAALPRYRHEIIMVNDGSGQETWETIRRLCAQTGETGDRSRAEKSGTEGMIRPEGVAGFDGIMIPGGMTEPDRITVPGGMTGPDGITVPEGMIGPGRPAGPQGIPGGGQEKRQEKEKEGRRTGCRRGYDLARNFGQHAALMAGIRHAQGEFIVCLDDDGQTPADEAGKLLAALEGGADVVYASYEHKEHSAFRNFGSLVNEKMLEWMLGKPEKLYVSSYFAMRRYVADEVLRYGNSYPYLPGLVLRTTDNIVNVPVRHRKRTAGSSGYTPARLLSLWMNGFTAFSVKPLRIGTGVGAVCAAGGVLYGVYTIIKKFVNPEVPVGWSALMTAVVFFGGMILVMLGLVGEYVGRTYITASAAPQYVIREETQDAQTMDTGKEETDG